MITSDDTDIIESNDGRFVFVVNKKFLRMYPDVKNVPRDSYELSTSFQIEKYLYNTKGPAILDRETGNKIYYVNGKAVSEIDYEKLQHTADFNQRAVDILNL